MIVEQGTVVCKDNTQTNSKIPVFSINRQVKNKTPRDGNFENVSVYWQTVNGLQALANEIKLGHATMAGLLPDEKTRRKKVNVIGSWAVFLDIDSSKIIVH